MFRNVSVSGCLNESHFISVQGYILAEVDSIKNEKKKTTDNG